MIHGFNLDNPLACEGIIGDGCGGGRWFLVDDEMLKAYDPQSKEVIVLLQNVKNAKKISKSGCDITIECTDKNIKFNLSTMKEG